MPATQEQVNEVRALMEQQDAARQKAVAAAVALVVLRTRQFDEWYSTVAITAWALSLTRGIEAIQRNLARQTDAILAREATVMSGRTVRPVGAVDVTSLRQGITHAGAYGRVADQYRYQQSLVEKAAQQPAALVDVKPVRAAIEAAVERAQAVAETDAQLVVREQSHKFMEAQPERPPEGRRLIGYRRILHPELSAGGSCGMCIVASHRLYKRDDLLPLHAHCNCLPMPVYDGADPGSIINDDDLERFYAEAGGKQFEDLGRTRYKVHQHAELGPVLTLQGAAFRTPGDVSDDERD